MSREEKQQYLREQILDSGFDGNNFQDFCEIKNPKAADDIDLWDFEELKQIVQEFKIKEKQEEDEYDDLKNSRISVDYTNPESMISDSDILGSTVESRSGSQLLDANDFKDQQDFQNKYDKERKSSTPQIESVFTLQSKLDAIHLNNIYECNKMPITEIMEYRHQNPKQKISVTIPEYNLKTEGFLNNQFAAFKVVTKPLDWIVIRRYNDFSWLRQMLLKFFPGILIPPISSKKTMRNLKQNYLDKRQQTLQNFLQYVMAEPTLSSSIFVENFLKITENGMFQRKQNESNNKQRPVKIQNFNTLDGKIEVLIDNSTKKYSNAYRDYQNGLDQLYRNIKQNSKKLVQQLEDINLTMLDTGKQFEQMEKIAAKFNQNTPYGKFGHMQKMYQTMSNFQNSWSETFIQQKEFIKTYYHDFFRYQTKINGVQKDFIRQRNQLQNLYTDAAKKLDERKEKLFNLKQTDRWDLNSGMKQNIDQLLQDKHEALKHILPNDSEQIKAMGLTFGVINKAFYDNTQHIQIQKHAHYAKHFQKFVKSLADNISNSHLQIADTMIDLAVKTDIQISPIYADPELAQMQSQQNLSRHQSMGGITQDQISQLSKMPNSMGKSSDIPMESIQNMSKSQNDLDDLNNNQQNRQSLTQSSTQFQQNPKKSFGQQQQQQLQQQQNLTQSASVSQQQQNINNNQNNNNNNPNIQDTSDENEFKRIKKAQQGNKKFKKEEETKQNHDKITNSFIETQFKD